jgi:hypothetical protein
MICQVLAVLVLVPLAAFAVSLALSVLVGPSLAQRGVGQNPPPADPPPKGGLSQ